MNANLKYTRPASTTDPVINVPSITKYRSWGGWGNPVYWEDDYEIIKHLCYLVMRYRVLCCIDVPDCPPGLVPEIPLKAYQIYKLKRLEIGSMVKESHDQDHVTYEEHSVEFSDSVKKNHRLYCTG